MLGELTLPGTIPGLLRKCSPIVCQTRPWGGWRGIYFGGLVGVAIVRPDEDDHVFIDAVLPELHLDLTDTTGRYHAALKWRAASRPRFGFRGDATGNGTLLRMHSPGVTYFSSGGQYAVAHQVKRPSYLAQADVVPALAGLDPNDDRRLTDGSRWVDAEALRRVVLHLGAK